MQARETVIDSMKVRTNFARRDFLRGVFAASALLATPRPLLALTNERRFAPVRVSKDRVIREVVGLRPYRNEGFVVAAEKVGSKLLVHNYGHGGGGVTLSWGTATLAVDLVGSFIAEQRGNRRPTQFAVIGCGVSGLSTALLLQRRYQNGPGTVTIYSKAIPPDTTSNIAGAWWSPTTVFAQGMTTAKFDEQFRQACQISNRAFQLLVGAEYGVRWIQTLELGRNESSFQRELAGGNSFYPQIKLHRDPDRYFGFPFVREFASMLIEPSIYLSTLLRDFYTAGGKLVVKEFATRQEIMRLRERVIFNCTGLGARELFKDEKLTPVRGQLEILLPQPEVDYCYLSAGHMFPRRDGIVLGGTWDHDDWSTTPSAEDAEWILQTHAEIMKGQKTF
jgi:glycine/D-amino acid oxidase-like deaminating enzyme